MRNWEPPSDHRAKATGGVALAALVLLLPFVALSVLQQRYAMAAGTAGIVVLLAANVLLVARGRDYERLTLYVLVPLGMLFMAHVFRVDGVVGGLWCFPSIIGCYCMLSRPRAIAANVIVLAVALPMTVATLEPALAARLCATLFASSLFTHILVREIDVQQARLRRQVEHDPLTGLLNRTSLKGRLEAAIDAHGRDAVPVALISIDLDHFKSINDRFGHEIGDLVLCEVARLLRSNLRAEDAVFRMGGEEFLVLLAGTTTSAAHSKAEALRRMIEEAMILQHHAVTASAGLAPHRLSDDRETWLRRADEALYTAKRTGRNRVVGPEERAASAATGSLPLALVSG